MFEHLQKHRRKYLWASLLFLLAMLPGLRELRLSPDNRIFYDLADPHYALLVEFEQLFQPTSNITFVLTASTPLSENAELAEAIRWVTDEAFSLPFARKVDSLSTYPFVRPDRSEITNASILDYVCPRNAQCISVNRKPLSDPAIQRRYISEDEKTAAVAVTLEFDIRQIQAVSNIHNASLDLAQTFNQRFPSFTIGQTGTVPLMQSYVDATIRDVSSVLILAMVTIVLLLFCTLGSLRLTALMLFLGTTTILCTMGLAGYGGLVIITSTATIPLIVFTIVLAASMHFFIHLLRTFDHEPSVSVISAVTRAHSSNIKPILFTSITTIAGLLSLCLANSPPIRQIGYWSAIGVIIGTYSTLIVVPLLSLTIAKQSTAPLQKVLQRLLNKHAKQMEAGRAAQWAPLLLVGIGIYGIANVSVDDDFVRYLSEETVFRKDAEFAARTLSSLSQVDIWIQTDEEAGILQNSSLTLISDLDTYLRGHPAVSNSLSVADIVSQIAEGLGETRSIPELSDEAIAQIFWVFEISQTYGQSSGDILSFDYSSARTSVLLRDVTAADIRQLDADIRNWMSQRSPDHITAQVTGEAIPISYLSITNIPFMAYGIGSSLLLTALLLGYYYRNLRLSIVVLCATALPVVCGLGVYSLLVDSIGLAAIVIVAVTIGIVIDDAIHLIFKQEEGKRLLDLNANESAAYALHRVGSAIVTTTAVLICGFSVLLFSDFHLNSSFGVCTGIILLTALVFDLYSLPKLLVWAAPNPVEPFPRIDVKS
jgi:predicted RND superfamily exporter protein